MSTDWREDADCRRSDPELWHSTDLGDQLEAKTICSGCSVRARCLEDALSGGSHSAAGIWGGLDEHERRRLRHSGWTRHDPLPDIDTTTRQTAAWRRALTATDCAHYHARHKAGHRDDDTRNGEREYTRRARTRRAA